MDSTLSAVKTAPLATGTLLSRLCLELNVLTTPLRMISATSWSCCHCPDRISHEALCLELELLEDPSRQRQQRTHEKHSSFRGQPYLERFIWRASHPKQTSKVLENYGLQQLDERKPPLLNITRTGMTVREKTKGDLNRSYLIKAYLFFTSLKFTFDYPAFFRLLGLPCFLIHFL